MKYKSINIISQIQKKSLVSSSMLIFGILLFLLSSFGCESSGDKAKYKFLPSSGGMSDEILWVMNDTFWTDTIGSVINNRFAKSYEVLPQAEPNYFIRQKSFQEFNNDIIKKYRTIVICTSKEADQEYNSVKEIIAYSGVEYQKALIIKNLWARPQLVVIITANNNEELLQLLVSDGERIEKTIREEEDLAITKLIYVGAPNAEAIKVISDNYGFSFSVPADYYVAKNENNFTWLRKETLNLSSNIMVYKSQLTDEQIKEGVDWKQYAIDMRQYLTKTYISSRVEGSYMEIESKHAPVLQEESEFLEHSTIVTKGLWRMQGDFLGGSFQNMAWFDKSTNTYYMIDVFVHAPKEGKKKFMRHLLNIINTAEKTTTKVEVN